MGNEKSATGESSVVEYAPIFNQSFEATVLNTRLNKNNLVNGGTVTQGNAMAILGTSTTTASTAQLESVAPGKYRPGLGGMIRFTVLFSAPVAGTKQLIGIADEKGSAQPFKNGYMIGYIGTDFGYHRFSNDGIISKLIETWDDPLNGKGNSRETIDKTKIGVWEISYQDAGSQEIYFEKSSSGKSELVHISPYANLNTEPSTRNSSFKFQMIVDNGATTSDIIMKCSSYGYFVQGKSSIMNIHQPLFSSLKREKTTVTTEVAIFTIRNKTIYAGMANFISADLQNISVSIEAAANNNLGTVRLVKNATLGGTPDYNDIDAANSIMEIDVAGTTVTGGVEELGINLAGKNDRISIGKDNFDLMINPGDSLTIAGNSANSATFDSNVRWKELV